jgi:hypothetical protein
MSDFKFVGPCKELSVPNVDGMSIQPYTSVHSFIFYNPETKEEMIKINKDGFWVRGIKVEQGPWEAEEVYFAFKKFLGVNHG